MKSTCTTKKSSARGCSLRSSKQQPTSGLVTSVMIVGLILVSSYPISETAAAAATAASAASAYNGQASGQARASGHSFVAGPHELYRTQPAASSAAMAASMAGGRGGFSQAAAAATTGASSNVMPASSPIRSRFRPPQPPKSYNRGPFGAVATAAATAPTTPITPIRSNQQQQQQQRQRQQQAASNKLQRQLDSMLSRLIELEEAETQSLADCSKWDHLNAKYLELARRQQLQQPFARPTEVRKRQECDELFKLISDFRARLQSFAGLAAQENGHLELVSQLVNQYADLRDTIVGAAAHGSAPFSQLEREFEQLKQADPQAQVTAENLDQFIGFMRQKLDIEPTVAAAAATAHSVVQSVDDIDLNQDGEIEGDNEIEELDGALRRLVGREELLGEEEHEQLAELSDLLESVLAEGHVDQRSAKFRYLFGTLEAARLVSLRKLRGNHSDEFQLGQPEPAGVKTETGAEVDQDEVDEEVVDDEQQQQQQQAEAEAMAYAGTLGNAGNHNQNVIFESAHAPRPMGSPLPPLPQPPTASSLKQLIEPVVSQQVAQAMAAARSSSGNNNQSASSAAAHAQANQQNQQLAGRAASSAASKSGDGNSAASAASTVSSSSTAPPSSPWLGMGERLRRRFASFQN